MQDIPTTIIGIMHVEFHIPMCNSLKEKRSVIRPIIHYLQDQFKLAAAEVADQDIWRSAILAMATVSSDKNVVEQVLNSARRYLEARPDIEVVDLSLEIL